MSGAPEEPTRGVDAATRRQFLARMSACLSAAAAAGCRGELEPEFIVPYVETPVGFEPGVAVHHATALTLGGFGRGVVVESREGRPIRIAGNPDHPASLGAVDPRTQAEILELYDPRRSRQTLHAGRPAPFRAAVGALREAVAPLRERGGRGLTILSGAVTSPSLAAQIAAIREALPEVRWHRWEPIDTAHAHAGARIAFGRPVDVVPDFARARVIAAFDADPFATDPGALAHARGFARRRRPGDGGPDATMSRVFAVESSPTLSGAKADARVAAAPTRVARILHRVAAALGVVAMVEDPGLSARERGFADIVARRLRAAGPEALVVVGRELPPECHALGLAVLHQLGAFGNTVRAIRPVEVDPVDPLESLSELASDLGAGAVDVLVAIGCNPALTAPGALDFPSALGRARFRLHAGQHVDETAAGCDWHVPLAHELETWGDCRAFDGTASVQQPVVRPLFGGRSALEICDALLRDEPRSPRVIVAERWRADAEPERWTEILRRGVVPGSAADAVDVAPRDLSGLEPPAPATGRFEIAVRPHPRLWDGRFAGNPWLQELPEPFTKLTWWDAALISPRTASELGIGDGDVVEVGSDIGTVRLPACAVPGQAPDVVTLRLGHGGMRAAEGARSANVHALRPLARADATVVLERVGAGGALPRTQGPLRAGEPPAVVTTDLETLREHPDEIAAAPAYREPEPGFPVAPPPPGSRQWGMVVDLTSCIGCHACVIGCQAENNVPTVGPNQVREGREMHWLRIDVYATGREPDVGYAFQPLACVHCEAAPCEYVCPVGATLHGAGGLNVMVYNRCIGTRYCANNCPYKVRRFNFLDFAHDEPVAAVPQRNPQVTVRSRGVMEKCTYCVQRINTARIAARMEDRPIRDGDVVTACQSACPTGAIVFGDIADPDTAVSRARRRPVDYLLLGHLNTAPRTSYGAAVRNPDPDLDL